jgi:hypothetical protein
VRPIILDRCAITRDSTVEDDTLNRSARLPYAFDRLLALPDRLASLFRARRSAPPPSVKLGVEMMEQRVVLDARPLLHPVLFVSSGSNEAVVKAYNADTGTLRFSANLEAVFPGAVRVAAGDFTGDGTPDAVIASYGNGGHIVILDGRTGTPIAGSLGSFDAYSSVLRGGVSIATGDVEGDGVTDLITAAQTENGLEVKAFRGTDGHVLADFRVSGAAFQHGITIAAGDFTGAGKADIVVGGSDGWVKTFDPLTGTTIGGPLGNFQAFGPWFNAGVVSVAADPLAGVAHPGGTSELAVGTGSGSPAWVQVLSATGAVLDEFQPFGSAFGGGARVALAYISNSANPTVPDIVVGSGPGTARVKVFSGATGAQLAAPLGAYAPFGDDVNGGVFVAASNDPLFPMLAVEFNGGLTSSFVAGQVFQIRAHMYGGGMPVLTPTGTVTFTVTNGSSVTTTLGTATLASTGFPAEAISGSLGTAWAAGTYTVTATYSGDANFNPTTATASLTISAPAANVPAAVARGGYNADLLGTPAGAGVHRSEKSRRPGPKSRRPTRP